MRSRVTVVIATRNRAAELSRVLDRLAALPEHPPVIVIDNDSQDATRRVVRERSVRLVTLPSNRGAAARTLGARLADTPYVAFSDDDSWWAPGALGRAADLLDAYPRVGLIAARTVVGSNEWPDFVNWSMARSPIGSVRHDAADLPGAPVLGFLACASIVRREALLGIGGFAPFLGVGGEERLVACDLRAAGWDLAYVHDIVAHHYPSRVRNAAARRARTLRNDLLIDLLRRPWPVVGSSARRLLSAAPHDPAARAAIAAAARMAPVLISQRSALPERVEAEARALETEGSFGAV